MITYSTLAVEPDNQDRKESQPAACLFTYLNAAAEAVQLFRSLDDDFALKILTVTEASRHTFRSEVDVSLVPPSNLFDLIASVLTSTYGQWRLKKDLRANRKTNGLHSALYYRYQSQMTAGGMSCEDDKGYR